MGSLSSKQNNAGVISRTRIMKVAIIGCGYSGLSAIRRCQEFGIECIAFDLNDQIGGLWLYTNRIGVDEFGIPIQTSLYESLRTNSPKQNLELPDFPFRTEENTCYPRHTEVLRYLQEFAEHFKLLPHIKLRHYVTSVSRLRNKWKIEVKNLRNECFEIHYFDAVMVCNGHTTQPNIPKVSGVASFSGIQLHSHDYRCKSIFTDKKVLIIGSGPSGTEIAHEASSVATKVYMSQRSSYLGTFHAVEWKPVVKEIRESEVVFADESVEKIDVIVYCTGYLYYFPFLDESCGVRVEEDGQIVQPLYKHYINIHHPSMCFIGLFQYVIVSYLFDLQAQAFLKFLTKQIDLPSKSAMLDWLDAETRRRTRSGVKPHHYYKFSAEMEDYFKDITSEAKLPNIPPVLFKIFYKNEETYNENFLEARRWYFEIKDQNRYEAYLQTIES